MSKRAGEESAGTALGGQDTEEQETVVRRRNAFGHSLFALRPCRELMVFRHIFHGGRSHLQHWISILGFADIWKRSDTPRAVVVRLRVWDKEAVSAPGI